jgi:hypothetical protein
MSTDNEKVKGTSFLLILINIKGIAAVDHYCTINRAGQPPLFFRYSTIRLIDGEEKSLRLKNNLERDFAAPVYMSEAPSMPSSLHGFCLGVVEPFCRFQV